MLLADPDKFAEILETGQIEKASKVSYQLCSSDSEFHALISFPDEIMVSPSPYAQYPNNHSCRDAHLKQS